VPLAVASLAWTSAAVGGSPGVLAFQHSPYYVAVKLRTHGHHKGHRSFWEWDDEFGSWMLMVLDGKRNLVGQVFGRTQEACHRKMNSIYEAKDLGVYNGQYAAPQVA
jgi:hypothetical protein